MLKTTNCCFFNRDEIKKWSFLFKKMSVILSFGHN